MRQPVTWHSSKRQVVIRCLLIGVAAIILALLGIAAHGELLAIYHATIIMFRWINGRWLNAIVITAVAGVVAAVAAVAAAVGPFAIRRMDHREAENRRQAAGLSRDWAAHGSYQAIIRSIAPADRLRDREADLDALTAFCTGEDVDWWY